MKTRFTIFTLLLVGLLTSTSIFAEEVVRKVATFSEVILRIDAQVYIEQGDEQRVEIGAKRATLDELITDVKGRALIIRFPNKTFFRNDFKPGPIEIHITIPDIDKLSVSGSGNIFAPDVKSRIIDLAVSGSGDIVIDDLTTKRVSATISGSGNIIIKHGGNVADELKAAISGSGNIKAKNFEATNIVVHTAGSGSCFITSNGSIKARIAGSGNVNYKGNPSIDSSVAGSGRVREL
jgi:hypothetical protein